MFALDSTHAENKNGLVVEWMNDCKKRWIVAGLVGWTNGQNKCMDGLTGGLINGGRLACVIVLSSYDVQSVTKPAVVMSAGEASKTYSEDIILSYVKM